MFLVVFPTGRIAALNMLSQEVELDSVPYFWTMLFGKSIRYAGTPVVRGSYFVSSSKDSQYKELTRKYLQAK